MNNNPPRSGIARQTSLLIPLALLGPAVGFLLELLLARTYGTSGLMDAFRIAALIHLFGLNILFTQLMPHVVVPAFSALAAREGTAGAWRATLSFNAVLSLAGALGVLVIALKADVVVSLLGPGLAAEVRPQAILLVCAACLSLVLIAFSGTLSAALGAIGILWPSRVTPPLISGLMIASIFWLHGRHPAFALAIGLTAGSAAVALLHVIRAQLCCSALGIGRVPGCGPGGGRSSRSLPERSRRWAGPR